MITYYRSFSLLLLVILFSNTVFSQNNTWTAQASFPGTARMHATSFVINDKAYICGGQDASNTLLKSFWMYNATTNTWTQLANFAGTARKGASAFTIGTKAYVVGGQDSTGAVKDVWEYNSVTASWTAKAVFPGTARAYATAFAVGNKGYYGLGFNTTDLWEYDTLANSWTQKAGITGSSGAFVLSFVINGKAYCAGGSPSIGFKEYNPATNTWTSKNDSTEATGRSEGVAFTLDNKGYIGLGTVPIMNGADLWSYNPSTDTWTKRQTLNAMPRSGSVGFSIGNKGYVTTGQNFIGQLVTDLQMYKDDSMTFSTQISAVTSAVCAGQQISVTYTTSNTFNTGNQFITQLSDSAGNFNSPIVLDTLSATSGGSFNARIPSSSAGGLGYRIRLVSTNPVSIGSASNPIAIGAKPIVGGVTGDTIVTVGGVHFYSVPARTGSTYKWLVVNGTGSSTTNAIAISWSTPGTVRLSVIETSALGCVSDTAGEDIQITLPSGIDQLEGSNGKVNIFPNPGSGIFVIEGLREQAVIMDIVGNEVMKIKKDGEVDLTGCPAGIYFIKSGSVIQKISKY